MPRYFLELAYKGTSYSGFQWQLNARTVQSEVTRAMQMVLRVPFELTGSSRTDAGVHARQNFFHFDFDGVIHSGHLYNLNAVLPQDIALRGVYPVPEAAHSRFDAISREYNYFIYNRKDPFLADRGWMYPYPVDIDLLRQAAALVQEYEDFTSFSKRNTQVKTYRCRIEVSEWEEREGGLLVYRVRANRFLRGMVRGMVGTMLKVGRGQMTLEGLAAVLDAKDCTGADFSTPAQGLFLTAVNYPEDLRRYFTTREREEGSL